MLLFKNIKGDRLDPVQHTIEVLKNYPYAEIHIGTDSQNINKQTHYTTVIACLLYTSPSPRDMSASRMPSSA